MKIHELKSWPEEFRAIKAEKKRATLRADDRVFKQGDFLHLREYKPDLRTHTGSELVLRITHIQRCGEPPLEELPEGWVMLSLHVLPA